MTDTIQEQLRDEAAYRKKNEGILESLEELAADEIERLERELAEANEAIGLLTTLAPQVEIDPDHPLNMAKEIVRVVAEKDKRIEELEDDKKFWKNPPNGVWVEKDAINAAWEKSFGEEGATTVWIDAMDLGIIPCPKCGGTKRRPGEGAVSRSFFPCDCPNNGWVIGGGDE